MSDIEKIKGPPLIEIFRQLIEDQTLVKVSLPNVDFEHLTLVIGLLTRRRGQGFQIDASKEFIDTVVTCKPRRILFEFTGRDRLPYRFQCDVQPDPDDIGWFLFPDAVERLQLRSDFRIRVPSDTHAMIPVDGQTHKSPIENISLGGVYCHLSLPHEPTLKIEERIEKVQLIVTLDQECQVLTVDRAEVRRVEPHVRPNIHGIALQFIGMPRNARRRLTEFIYQLQRNFLKNRLKPR